MILGYQYLSFQFLPCSSLDDKTYTHIVYVKLKYIHGLGFQVLLCGSRLYHFFQTPAIDGVSVARGVFLRSHVTLQNIFIYVSWIWIRMDYSIS
jgi:hypothetical protein